MEERRRRTRQLALGISLARVVLLWERLWPRLWPPVAILGLFALSVLFDLWSGLARPLHLALLALFALALVATLVLALRGLRWPTREEALARLERDSGFRHAPLRLYEDELAAGRDDPLARALWARERARLEALLDRLRLRAPSSALPRRDPWALRALLLLLLVVGWVDARGDLARRLAAAFDPGTPSTRLADSGPRLELWVDPPDYTGLAPRRLEELPADGRLRLPAGSELVVQLHQVPAGSRPRLRLDRKESQPLMPLAGRSYEWRRTIERDLELAVELEGAELAAFRLEVIPDQIPRVAFAGPPERTRRGSLEVRFEAEDDYGVAEVALLVRPLALEAAAAGEGIADLVARRMLSRPARRPRTAQGRGFVDLTAHPLAGLPAELVLEAVDAAGQRGRSGPLRLVLPQRAFRHPLARQVVAARRRLVEDPRRWALVGLELQALAQSEAARELGAAVPLTLFVAAARLLQDRTPAGRRSAVDLMWEIALFIEEGALALAERELRERQEALERALEEGASPEELERLMRELEASLDRYLRELERRALEALQQRAREQAEASRVPLDPARTLTRQDFEELLRRARELARSGQREAARELLAQLRRMLENLETPRRLEPSPLEQAVSELQRLMRAQQQLLDKTFRLAREPPPGAGAFDRRRGGERRDAAAVAAEQEALRRALDSLMRRLGEMRLRMPQALGQAELEMRRARDALRGGRPQPASEAQNRALDQLRRGGRAMLEQLREAMRRGNGGQPGPGGIGAPGRDPLGRARRNLGGFATGGVDVPEDYDLGRARGILEELLRRSGDFRRPAYERDYYRRLLDRF